MTLAGERGHTRPPDPASWYLHSHKTGTEASPGSTGNVKAAGEAILREPRHMGTAGQWRSTAWPATCLVASRWLCPDGGVRRVPTQSFAGGLLFRLTLPSMLTNVPLGKGAMNWAPRALLPLKRKAEFPGSTCERWIQDPSHSIHLTNPKAHENHRISQVGRDPRGPSSPTPCSSHGYLILSHLTKSITQMLLEERTLASALWKRRAGPS